VDLVDAPVLEPQSFAKRGAYHPCWWQSEVLPQDAQDDGFQDGAKHTHEQKECVEVSITLQGCEERLFLEFSLGHPFSPVL
jgi:hypothetical protein